MTQLAAGFAAKGLLILMTSSSEATGLAHSKVSLNAHSETDVPWYIQQYMKSFDKLQPQRIKTYV